MLFGSLADTWGGIAALLFSLWPLVLFATPFGGNRRKVKIPSLTTFFVIWLLLVLIRASLLFYPDLLFSFLVPEPLNTVIFLITGVTLLSLLVARRVVAQRRSNKGTHPVYSVKDLMALSPRAFEELTVELYATLGHHARRTGASGDHGVDVVVQAKNGEKWVVQCKRWRGNVGEPVVRDFYGVMHHEKADKGMIINAGGFTPQAQVWARGKPLKLVDGEQFLNYLKKARRTQAQ